MSLKTRTTRIILIPVGGLLLLVILAYLAVFGRALRQTDDHLGIARALPKVLCGGGVAEVDPRTYMTTDATKFRTYMEEHGFVEIEQMGSTHFYYKEGTRYLVTGRMYSAFFMVFHVYPEEKT